MKLASLSVTFCACITFLVTLLNVDAVESRSAELGADSVSVPRCFKDSELNQNLNTLKSQQGPELYKASRSLLAKARTSPGCRTEIIQELIRGIEEASKNLTKPYDNYFFFKHGASLLAELKATEALDLLVANIDLTDDYPSGLDDFPALVAIQRIGRPAIPKLERLLINDGDLERRRLAALATAYIGGAEAKRALAAALPHETDPCVKNFIAVSLQAFDNKERPNRVSRALNGKWLRAFYCS